MAAIEFVASGSPTEVTEFNNIARYESATPVTLLEVQHVLASGGAEMSAFKGRSAA